MMLALVLVLGATPIVGPRPRVVVIAAQAPTARETRLVTERFARALAEHYDVVAPDQPLGLGVAPDAVREALRRADASHAVAVVVRNAPGAYIVSLSAYDPASGQAHLVHRERLRRTALRRVSYWRRLVAKLDLQAPAQPHVGPPTAMPTTAAPATDDWDVAALQFDELPQSADTPSEDLWVFAARADFQHHSFRGDGAPGDILTGRDSIEARATVTFGRGTDYLRVEGDVRRDFDTPQRNRVALLEAYAAYQLGPLDVRIGHQLTAWGATTLIAPGDIIDRVDLRDIVRPEKLASLAARGTLTLGRFALELYLLPQPTVDRLPLNLQQALGEPRAIAVSAGHLQGAVRLSLAASRFDASVAVVSMYDHVPTLSLTPAPVFGQRRLLVGVVDVETTVQKLRIALDGAVFAPLDGQSFYGSAVLGLDYGTPQFLHDHSVHVYVEGLAARQARTDGATGMLDGLRTPFARALAARVTYDIGDRLQVNGGVYFDLQRGARAFLAAAELKIVTATRLRLGGEYLVGPTDSYFGAYRDDSRVFLELSLQL